MTWSSSKVFTAFVSDLLTQQVGFDLASAVGYTNVDALNVALYNDTITPSNTVTASATIYGNAQWASGGEVSSASGWAAGGLPLPTDRTITVVGSNVVLDTATDLNSTSNNVTLTNATGCLIYDVTRSNRGICYNWFGGSNTVINGTFTIIWSNSGIISFAT